MKGRPKSIRKISFMPAVSGFKPYGDNVKISKKNVVFLLYEEYEALRLNDYEMHSQCESAAIMQISRPTFTRIYRSAREKIAKAFVEGLRIVVEGGKVALDGDWYVCGKCKAVFSNENGLAKVCALCGSADIHPCSLSDSSEDKLILEDGLPLNHQSNSLPSETETEDGRGGCCCGKRKRCAHRNNKED